MGLDMYLNKVYHVSNDKYSITILKDEKPSQIPTDKIVLIKTEEIYWRKANAIHKWFVANVQHGEDDCGAYFVEVEQLFELLSIVKEVLNDHGKASALLPTQEGFFFGATDYDESYYDDLEHTKKELTRVLGDNSSSEVISRLTNTFDLGFYEYHSSW